MKYSGEELIFLYGSGKSLKDCAKILGVAKSGVGRRVANLGLSRHELMPPRKATDEQLTELYKTNGLLAISKKLDMSERRVATRLKKLGVLDSSRQHMRKPGHRRVSRRPRTAEFTGTTKKVRFSEESGVCQHCLEPIESWKHATYHHIVLVKDGGGPELTNCMVLHSACHNDPEVFEQLHGFRIERFELLA